VKPAAFGLPGTISDVALTLPTGLSYEQVRDGLRLVGRTGRALGWWAADLLVYAEVHFGEAKFSQLADELGYAPHTCQNLLTVGHAWPVKRRREALDVGHHSALAHLDKEDAEHYANLAEAGERLPNGETKRWSVTRLREELRALSPKKPPALPTAAAKTASKGITAESAAAAGSGNPDVRTPAFPILARGQIVELDDFPGRWRIKQVYRVPGELVVKLVEV